MACRYWCWGCRSVGRRTSLTKILIISCLVSILCLLINIHGAGDPQVHPQIRHVALPVTRPKTTPKTFEHKTASREHTMFKINEIQGKQLSYYDLQAVGDRFEERNRRVQTGCSGHETTLEGLSSKKWAYERIEIDTKRRILYCPLLKVGSTFWRRVFFAMRQNRTINTPYDVSIQNALVSKRDSLERILPLEKPETKRYLDSSTNIMFVREPYSRLLSGYVDKLFAPNPYFWNVIGRYIVKTYRRNPSSKSLACGHDVTFSEFVKYVIDTEEKNSTHRDAHFTQMYDQCKPCQIRYNIVGKMETFKDDTAFIFNALGYNVSVESLKLWAEKAEEDAIFDSTKSPFGWKKNILKCMSFFEAAKRIWHKMQIRGIVDRKIPMPYTEEKLKSVTSKVFIDGLMKARLESSREVLKAQKREVLRQAFASVPPDDMETYRKLFRPDFDLFGYDIYPRTIFSETNASTPWVFNLTSV